MTSMSAKEDELVRTTITIPKTLKKKMASSKTNWSKVIRETIAQMVEDSEPNMTEAVILNEKVRRKAPAGWSSLKVIKQWRKASS